MTTLLAPVERIRALAPDELRRRSDPRTFAFATTAELPDPPEGFGQARALEALRFGIAMETDRYHVFALGPSGLGKRSLIRAVLEAEAARRPAPGDWCYVHNFADPRRPRALALPPGRGVGLRRDMRRLVEDLRVAIPAAFEREDYRTRKTLLERELKERGDKAFGALEARAREKGLVVIRTPLGVMAAPGKDGEVLESHELHRLPEEVRERYRVDMAALQEEIQALLAEAPRWEHELRDKVRKLDREVTAGAAGHLVEALRARYQDVPAVRAYLEEVQEDVVDRANSFLSPADAPEGTAALLSRLGREAGESALRRYEVNAFVDRDAATGAPVVCLEHPSHRNLIGNVEHLSELGALVTDFRLVKAGALHQANGGYLVIDALKLLRQPFAWDTLKRALQTRQARIEPPGELLTLLNPVSLEPEAIPLDLNVVLVGERLLYYLLAEADPEFLELFKVAADFEEDVERTAESEQLYARLLGRLAREHRLLPLDPSAVARTVEHGSRLVSDAERLSVHLEGLTELLREADHWARAAGRPAIAAEDVRRAVDAQVRRSDRLRDRLQEEVRRGILLVDTKGAVTGQVNGLSVMRLGAFAFGRPTRITARVRLGSGGVLDIEREVKLGGPIHSKGVLILSGFLGQRYASDRPLSLSASLVFEQSYGGVEGDSASVAELLALLSALAGAPVRQCLAVTGSVDQLGRVQPVGGVNEKIEGFFDVCRAKGATGEEGVILPAANVSHLMLRPDVVEAVAEGRFHIHPIETVDEGLELVTGIPAGERDAGGAFPAGSVNQRVESRLATLAEEARAFGRGAGETTVAPPAGSGARDSTGS